MLGKQALPGGKAWGTETWGRLFLTSCPVPASFEPDFLSCCPCPPSFSGYWNLNPFSEAIYFSNC